LRASVGSTEAIPLNGDHRTDGRYLEASAPSFAGCAPLVRLRSQRRSGRRSMVRLSGQGPASDRSVPTASDPDRAGSPAGGAPSSDQARPDRSPTGAGPGRGPGLARWPAGDGAPEHRLPLSSGAPWRTMRVRAGLGSGWCAPGGGAFASWPVWRSGPARDVTSTPAPFRARGEDPIIAS
jgi:hypothetical protein